MSQITAVILGSGGAGPILTLTGNSGGAVAPSAGNINIVGSGILSVAGNPGTHTLTISATNPIPIANGGTNATSMTNTFGVNYFDGTRIVTTTVGTAGQVLTSNGAGVAPTYQAASGGITSITGDSGAAQSGPAITLTGGTSGGTFAGAANTLTLAFTELNLPATSDSSHGVININGTPVLQAFGANTDENIFVGLSAGNFSLTSGSATANTGIGTSVLAGLTNGNSNTAVGRRSQQVNATGINNTSIGVASLLSFTGGNNNTAIGQGAMYQLVSGSGNSALGQAAGSNYTGAESGNINIGTAGVTGESNVCRIANIFGATTSGAGVPVVVDNTSLLGTVVSSIRFKENVNEMGSYSNDIHNLKPVTFNFKKDASKSKTVGLIAEDVEHDMPSLLVRDDEGLPLTVKYLDLIPMLLNEVQKLRKELNVLKGE